MKGGDAIKHIDKNLNSRLIQPGREASQKQYAKGGPNEAKKLLSLGIQPKKLRSTDCGLFSCPKYISLLILCC
ncbi:MAG: hypothetical protein UX02_C0002G0048 [Candidatus Moranbacteria bacterium GW2011_GWC1_45_18]|nr:MAG: hypothetical protein UT79_C0001G0413 [Candidatus Moranbacteria bacterium GW2011_GWC2_40_12]KKT32438.1 MAG: hypothetical protein UW19_C0021G0005 [Candidatus Moranbacteria bacterium GW2011_GWF2_44_10]KKT71471.1 MAG: hypothetical protein UW66_C0031G0002 [Candidatus Moranbacteria bacterium GW2011_GWF1_44_4]KKT99729.1 MAG: hypothetical protein UX02_C0002G0048 [Candidatus Moranbacteria bacterium GW2011_GWC1_45_18]OGI24340.1 MAG: hypothetical protein A2194_04300 [Candidatus Moranbacteria bacte